MGLHVSGEGLLGRWLTQRNQLSECIPRVKMRLFDYQRYLIDKESVRDKQI